MHAVRYSSLKGRAFARAAQAGPAGGLTNGYLVQPLALISQVLPQAGFGQIDVALDAAQDFIANDVLVAELD